MKLQGIVERQGKEYKVYTHDLTDGVVCSVGIDTAIPDCELRQRIYKEMSYVDRLKEEDNSKRIREVEAAAAFFHSSEGLDRFFRLKRGIKEGKISKHSWEWCKEEPKLAEILDLLHGRASCTYDEYTSAGSTSFRPSALVPWIAYEMAPFHVVEDSRVILESLRNVATSPYQRIPALLSFSATEKGYELLAKALALYFPIEESQKEAYTRITKWENSLQRTLTSEEKYFLQLVLPVASYRTRFVLEVSEVFQEIHKKTAEIQLPSLPIERLIIYDDKKQLECITNPELLAEIGLMTKRVPAWYIEQDKLGVIIEIIKPNNCRFDWLPLPQRDIDYMIKKMEKAGGFDYLPSLIKAVHVK